MTLDAFIRLPWPFASWDLTTDGKVDFIANCSAMEWRSVAVAWNVIRRVSMPGLASGRQF
jgi:hypothetical protein